jgi:hypothetical protein
LDSSGRKASILAFLEGKSKGEIQDLSSREVADACKIPWTGKNGSLIDHILNEHFYGNMLSDA